MSKKRKHLVVILCLLLIPAGIWIVYSINYFTGEKTQEHPLCEKILNGTNSDEDNINLPVSCKKSINGQDFIFNILSSNKLSVAVNSKTVFENGDEFSNYVNLYEINSQKKLNGGVLKLEDITFDGHLDLEITQSCGAYQCSYAFYAFNPQSNAFDFILEGENASVDTEKKTINFFEKGRGLADIFTESTYKFIDGKYTLIREESQDFADSPHDELNGNYIHTIRELINGEMITIKTESLSHKDVWSD